MQVLKMARDGALGNGSRQRGDVLAEIDDVEPQELLAEAFGLIENKLDKLPGKLRLLEGVEPIEVLTALRNPQLCEFEDVSDSKAEASVADTDEAPQRDGPGLFNWPEAEHAKPAPKPKRPARKKKT